MGFRGPIGANLRKPLELCLPVGIYRPDFAGLRGASSLRGEADAAAALLILIGGSIFVIPKLEQVTGRAFSGYGTASTIVL